MRMLGDGSLAAKVEEVAAKIQSHIHEGCQRCMENNIG